MQKKWRKLDNTAKVFSLANKKNTNTYRLSGVLYEEIDAMILKSAVIKSLESYSCYKVKNKTGLFWNYLEINPKEPIVEEEKDISCSRINLKNSNDYLFKVSYYKNRISLDVVHILTDGIGAIELFKSIVCNYLDMKYKLGDSSSLKKSDKPFYEDQYLKCADKRLKNKFSYKKAYLIEQESDFSINKTYHYIIPLDKLKGLCKKKNVSITEYLTSIYMLAIYNTLYNKESNKDIVLTIPIDLRKYYNIETPSNFFTCMCVDGNIVGEEKVTLDSLLVQIHKEFKEKLTENNVKKF